MHHAGATLHGQGGAVVRVDVRIPRGYRIVVEDPVRIHSGTIAFEVARGRAQYGVLTLRPAGVSPSAYSPAPAGPVARPTPRSVARSWLVASSDRLIREGNDRYLLVRDGRPRQLFVPLRGALHGVFMGEGAGRALLTAVARTLVARWIAPVPLATPSDADALALRDQVNAAIRAQDAYSYTDDGGTVDVARARRYAARFDDPARTHPDELVIAGTEYIRESDTCWTTRGAPGNRPFPADTLPTAAPGLRFGPIDRSDGRLRLSYQYWTYEANPITVQVELDPATLLPLATATSARLTTITYTQTRTWTWGPVVRRRVPRVCG